MEVFNCNLIVCICFLLKCKGLDTISDLTWVDAEFKWGENTAAQIIGSKDRCFPGVEVFFS